MSSVHIYFTIQSFRRHFMLKFGSYVILDEFKAELERLLHPLKVYEEDPSGNKKEPYKLYYNHELTYHIPSAFLGEVFILLRSKYPQREHYHLIDLHKHNSGAEMDLKIKPSYKLRDYQQEYHDLIVNGKEDRIFVDLRTGTGKASWVKSKVLTNKGFIPLEKLEVGDQVIGLTGKTKVKAIHPQGKKQLYKVTTNDGRSHICTDDHHWEVIVGKKGTFRVMSTKQLRSYLKRKIEVQMPVVIPKAYYEFMYKSQIKFFGELMSNSGGLIDYDKEEAVHEEAMKLVISIFHGFDTEEEARIEAGLDFLRHAYLFPFRIKVLIIMSVLQDDMTTITRVDRGKFHVYMRFDKPEIAECIALLFKSIDLKTSVTDLGAYTEVEFRISGLDEKVLEDDGVTIQMAIANTIDTILNIYKSTIPNNATNLIKYYPLENIEEHIEDDAICIEVADPNALYGVDDFLMTHNSFISTCAVVTRKKRVGFILLPRYIDKWEEDFLEYTNIKHNRIYKVKGKESIEELLRDKNYQNYDVILFSIRTLYNLWKDFEKGDRSISPLTLFTELEIGTLVSDESHQELNAVFKILTYSDVDKIIGMSATYISSKASERRIQDLLFPPNTRASNLVEFDNYIEYFDCPYTLDTTGGMVKHKSFQGYSQVIFETNLRKKRDLVENYFYMIYQLFLQDFLVRRQKGDKALVYFGLVDMCKDFVDFLKQRDEIKEKKLDIRKYTQEDDYETIKVGDVIVSTLQSLSTAFTVPDLIAVYNTVSVRSPKANLQSMGRLRKLKGKATKFYNVYARNLSPHKVNAKNRVEQSRNFVKSIGRIDLGFVSKY